MDRATYGNNDVAEALCEIAGHHRKKRRIIGSLISRVNTDFRVIFESNLGAEFKERFLLWLKAFYKRNVFDDIRVLTENEKRWLYSYVVIKWREYRDKLKEN